MLKITVDEQIELRSLQVDFAPLYVELVKHNYDYLCQWLVWPPKMHGAEDFVQFIKHCQKEQLQGRGITLGIIYLGKLVGNMAFKGINHQLKKVEFGYWLAADWQGKGIVSRACKTMVEYAFNELDLDKVEMHVATENYPSQRVCERLGMKAQGVITRAENLHGNIVDHQVYGLQRI
jgi:ribosomal-protein-serine acetyltransferase